MALTIPAYIEVRTAAGETAACLSPGADGLKDVSIDIELNGSGSLTFSLPMRSDKWAYLTDANRIIAGDREFVVTRPDAVEISRDGQKLWGRVNAQESWVLLNKRYVTVSNDPANPSPGWGIVSIISGGTASGGFTPGGAGSALSHLLNGSGWTVDVVDVTGIHDLETEMKSLLSNINKVQELWGGYLVWDSINKKVSLRSESAWQNYTGFQIRYAKNLKDITRTVDYDIVTRLYPFGSDNLNISSVNNGELYIDDFSYSQDVREGIYHNQDIEDPQQLKERAAEILSKLSGPRYNYRVGMVDLRMLPDYSHEDFSVGDMVDVVDEGLGISVKSRITRYKYDVFQPWKCDLDIGDPLESLASMIADGSQAADYIKGTLKPNTGIGNLLKGLLDTAATEINGAGGSYSVVDGVSTWAEKVNGAPTGRMVRATPGGIMVSSDGGQTAKTAITGDGVAAGVIIGQLIAGEKLTIGNAAGNFLVDQTGAQMEDLNLTVTRSDGKSKVVINPTDGIKIQSSGVDKFYADTAGRLVAEDLVANRLIVKSGNDVLIDGNARTIDFSKFSTKLGEVSVNNVPIYELIQSMNNYSGSLNGSVIKADTITGNHLKADAIDGKTINGITINGVIINGGNISVSSDLSIGSNIFMNPGTLGTIAWKSGSIEYGSITMDSPGKVLALYGANQTSIGKFNTTTYIHGNVVFDSPIIARFG